MTYDEHAARSGTAESAAALPPVDADEASASPFPVRVPWPAVGTYVVIAFGLAWLICLPLWLSGEGLNTPGAIFLIVAMMYTPAAAALIVAFFVQRPRPRPLREYLGVWPLTPAKRVIGLTVVGLLGSILVVVASVFLAAALGLVKLDLVHFSAFRELLAAAAHGKAIPLPIGLLVLIQLVSLPFASVFNTLATVGEELGWRGWLLPSLRPLGTWPALILTGVVWGLWHAPIILLGYDFAQPNLFGLLMMVGGCLFLGILVGWLRLRSGSVWPSVFAHAGFNGAAGILTLLAAAGSRPDPVIVGPLGLVPWIVMAVIAVVLVLTGQFRRQPRLGRVPQPAAVTSR
ncbi:CPBP family intramembrane metalloprotease [Planctomonas sp. JC2975]|uniref:CPBP family intramembrane glutamic endopeptidase n=1 Tax=Planctomonas sp. JC2975 TaxID=2729626 RepID=UPI0014752D83|nr:CPBP family intramembrane glutamic endopeptidase [Planctomonas sp. JC2975]NNC11308.1 CPBP family intramembrane metalloprotease [Planctomonas sp. JC2975]